VTTFSDPPGPYGQAGDSAVAFDLRHHSWLISYLAAAAGPPLVVDVLVSRSHDGVHWDLPVPVAALKAFLDKSWTVCDNSPRLVQPSGRVVVPFFGLCAGRAQLCAITSDNGGDSWTTPTAIATRIFHPTVPVLRTPPLPSAAIDREGRIYVVWKDCRFEPLCFVDRDFSTNDLVVSTSDDGVSWSPVRRIPLDPIASNVDHFVPGIDVDPFSAGSDARLALTYYFLKPADCTHSHDPAASCELYVGFVSSTDGGQTWSVPEVLAGPMRLNWLARTKDQGAMVGDYISTSVLNDDGEAVALPAFAVASPPQDGTLHEAIFTARLKISGGEVPVGDDVSISDRAPEDAP
jgi:hypothetical protein